MDIGEVLEEQGPRVLEGLKVVSYKQFRAQEAGLELVWRLLFEKKKKQKREHKN